ncbi:hypothetical protein GEMRC1_012413 [Eukaryota sp. GEM-RC1]
MPPKSPPEIPKGYFIQRYTYSNMSNILSTFHSGIHSSLSPFISKTHSRLYYIPFLLTFITPSLRPLAVLKPAEMNYMYEIVEKLSLFGLTYSKSFKPSFLIDDQTSPFQLDPPVNDLLFFTEKLPVLRDEHKQWFIREVEHFKIKNIKNIGMQSGLDDFEALIEPSQPIDDMIEDVEMESYSQEFSQSKPTSFSQSNIKTIDLIKSPEVKRKRTGLATFLAIGSPTSTPKIENLQFL